MENNKKCKSCNGAGIIVVGENLVTRDMAIDAGYPEMEGTHHSWAEEPCVECEGTGIIQII